MSLLRRFTKSAKDTSEVIQDIKIYTIKSDSVIVRTWGFVYNIMQDKDTPFDSKKIGFATTDLYQGSFPIEKINAKVDSVRNR